MSSRRVGSAIAALREGAAGAAWSQWGAIYSFAAARGPVSAIVDPEALLLASLALCRHEARLWRVARLWARDGSRLLSVQRTKNIARSFPAGATSKLSEFARVSTEDGSDIRWRSLIADNGPLVTTERRAPEAMPVLDGPAAIMLRMRLALGAGIKADAITYLVGLAGGKATVQQIVSATAYQSRAVRRALEELTASGFIEVRATAPVSYRVALQKWSGLLRIDADTPPLWRSWASVFGFVAAVDAWWDGVAKAGEFVMASEARDLVARHSRALESSGIALPPVDEWAGEGFLEPFADALEGCRDFLTASI